MELQQLFEKIRLPEDTAWYSLREVEETTTLRSVRDGKPATNSSDISSGIMIEVLVNGQFAYAALPTRDVQSLAAAAERAYHMAKLASPHGIFRFSAAQRPKAVGTYNSPLQKDFSARLPGAVNDFLIQVSERMRVSPKITRTTATLRLVESRVRYLSSNGSDISQNFHLVSTNYGATAQDGGLVQNRTDGGLLARSHQTGFEVLDDPTIMDRALQVGEQAVELLSAEECPTTAADLVLMPDQMMLQIHESIGHPLEIDRILGDERNYAGSSFVKLADFGSLTYGSPLMNITFDPTVPGEFASYSFDDNGAEAKREFLIKEGKLLRGLGGLESQIRSGVAGVANSRASLWNRPPIDRMANINLEPGASSFEEIIASVKEGILMESNRSWSIDDYRRKFQFGCEYAKWIQNGKITKTIRNPNYRGISVPFWKSLKMVGNKSSVDTCGTPYCGKGEPNQAIRVGHASPVCLFEKVEIFGGAG